MTALTHGANRSGKGTASPTTARVRAAFVRLHSRLGRCPTVAEVHAELAAGRIALREEAVEMHLRLAGLRAVEGTA